MWKTVESVVARRRVVLWPMRCLSWSGSSWFKDGGNTDEPEYANGFAHGTVRRLKFADRTFSAKGRERVANRSGGGRDAANAAPSFR